MGMLFTWKDTGPAVSLVAEREEAAAILKNSPPAAFQRREQNSAVLPNAASVGFT